MAASTSPDAPLKVSSRVLFRYHLTAGLVHLDTGDANPTNRLIKDAGIIGAIEREIEMLQFAHILQPERGTGIAEPPQHTFNTTLDLTGRLVKSVIYAATDYFRSGSW